MKKFVRTIKKSIRPLFLIPVVLVAGLIVGGILLFGGGGDDDDGVPKANPSLGFAEGDPSQLPGSKRPPPKQAPVVRTGTLDEARREGRLAVAQARGTILGPTRVRIRVSAAPKQTVSVNWQLGCYRDRRARVGKGQYRTTAPDVRAVRIPMRSPKSCIATASGQLTDPDRPGRIKIAIVSG